MQKSELEWDGEITRQMTGSLRTPCERNGSLLQSNYPICFWFPQCSGDNSIILNVFHGTGRSTKELLLNLEDLFGSLNSGKGITEGMIALKY